MAELAVIDLEPYYGGGAADALAVARRLDEACRELGFFSVIGHRVDASLITETRAAVRAFFELSLEEKLATSRNGWGYMPVESEALSLTTSEASPPDFKESFSMGPVDIGPDPYYVYEPTGWFRSTVWPTGLDSLESSMSSYYRQLTALARDLLELTAIAFELSPDWFNSKIDRAMSSLRVLHYPREALLRPGQYLAAPHSDYGTLTILHKRSGRTGLEAQTIDGSWVEVCAPGDGFIVNVGDLLMRWTGGHWLSTLHRVMPVDDADPEGEVSLVFFQEPNWDVVVYPFTSAVVPRRELGERYAADSVNRHYLGVMVSEFVQSKFSATVSDDAVG